MNTTQFFVAAIISMVAGFAQTPSITNVTNAAIPAIDAPPDKVHLQPRSMATIFGNNLADFTVTGVPPWPSSLGGTEVHFVVDRITYGIDGGSNFTAPCSENCELIGTLVFASRTQINVVLPDVPLVGNSRIIERSRIVLIRDGIRYDAR